MESGSKHTGMEWTPVGGQGAKWGFSAVEEGIQ